MTKKLLLAASAMGALAFAGAAGANEITVAKLSNQTVYDSSNSPASTPYAVASETISSNATRTTTGTVGHNTVAFELEDGAQFGATYQYTFNLTGAVFTAAVVAGNLATSVHADCFTITKTAAGTANTSTATYQLVARAASNANCTAGAMDGPIVLTFDASQLRASSIGNVGFNVVGGLSNGNTLVGADGRADISQTITLAQAATGYESRISAVIGGTAGTDTMLGLDDHSFIKGDSLLGSVGYAQASLPNNAGGVAYLGFNATNLPNVESDIELAITNSDFETLIPANFTVDEDDIDYAILEDATGFENVNVSLVSGWEGAIATGAVTVNATVTPKEPVAFANAIALPEAFSGQLEVIQLEGTTFLAPWVQSSNPNYNTVIRLSNSGSRPSGQVQLALTSPLRAPTATTCTLAGVPANGELAISSAQLSTCFGDFGRGDVALTVLSVGDSLTAKLRIVSPGNVVSEQTLNQTSGAGL